ncbi:ATP-binding protein [Solibacillus daqui]|uniref:ATP-binding protein n=1 Tax=Solibacillus daqui TaxID=2912187 RepID=UPI002365C1EC|nr:ATP-binding protein [Solibacillus daqui]
MELLFLQVENYKIIENQSIVFKPSGSYPSYYKDYYSNNFTVLVGENGQGKTTLLSMITNIFHNLERYHNRIFSNFFLFYSITVEGKKHRVLIQKYEESIYIAIKDVIGYSLLLETDPFKKGKFNKEDFKYGDVVTYDQIKRFLPSKIIGSVFSFHGEYPFERPRTYIGEKRVSIYDISKIYGANHYSFNSISNGIANFIEIFKEDKESLVNVFEIFNLTFENKVRVYDLDYSGDSVISEYMDAEGWVEINGITFDLLMHKQANGELYLNDLSFIKNGVHVNLRNMSSGEKMFFVRILSILTEIEDNSIIVIEEPELHLNPAWTKQIITILNYFFKKYNVHFLISTHNYTFINTLFPENIITVQNGTFRNLPQSTKTFLASEAEINSIFFTNTYNNNYTEAIVSEKVANGTVDELKEIFDYLGESYMRFKVFNEMLRKNNVESN